MENSKVNAEILGVLLALGDKYINKLPSSVMEYLTKNANMSEIPYIDQQKRIEEQKKNTLDNVKNRMNLTKDDTIDTVENVMLDEEKTLLNDDISKLKKDKENATLGDLEQIFINKSCKI